MVQFVSKFPISNTHYIQEKVNRDPLTTKINDSNDDSLCIGACKSQNMTDWLPY